MAINIAIGEEPKKLTTSHACVPFTSQMLAMVVEIMMIAGISGTRIETPKDGRLFWSTGTSAFMNDGVGRSRLPRNFGRISPAQITLGMVTRIP